MNSLTTLTKKDFTQYNNKFLTMHDIRVNKIYSLVIANTGNTHDSGYNCIRVYALDDECNILGIITSYSDVIHFNGIGGYGKERDWNSPLSNLVERQSYCIDLLPCGYFRIFKGICKPFDFSDFIGSDLQIY